MPLSALLVRVTSFCVLQVGALDAEMFLAVLPNAVGFRASWQRYCCRRALLCVKSPKVQVAYNGKVELLFASNFGSARSLRILAHIEKVTDFSLQSECSILAI